MAGFDLATAIIEIVGDPSKFEAALKKADKDGGGFVKKMGASFGALAKIAIPAGIIATVGALAKKALDAGEQISLMAQRTGVSAENLTRLTYAGGLSGVTLETVGGAMGKLARQMAKGEDEMGKSSKALQRMGVSATDSTGKMRPMLDVVLDVSDAFKKMDPASRLNASMEIFGREGGQKMIDVLSMGREELKKLMEESDRVGYTMSTKTARQLDEFGDVIDRANLRMQAMARVATVTLIPAINQLGEMFKDDFPNMVKLGLWDKIGHYTKRFIFGIVSGFDLILSAIKALFIGIGYTLDVGIEKMKNWLTATSAIIKNTFQAVIMQVENTWARLQNLKPITNALGLPSIENIKHNMALLKQVREENDKMWQESVDKNIDISQNVVDRNTEIQKQFEAMRGDQLDDIVKVLENSLNRSQKLWDEYFEHVAEAQEGANKGGGGPRQLTDAEKEAILAIREQIKQREIEIATMKGQHLTAYKLKLELIDIMKQKLQLKDIPTKLIDQVVAAEQKKALAEFNKISEENSRLAKGQIADMELAMATAAGWTEEIRRLSEAKVALTIAEMREKGVTEDLIARYKELASDELNDRLARSSEEALKKISALHREYAYDVLEATMTEGEKARLAAKEKLEKRLDDLRLFGSTHVDLWKEVLAAQKEAYSAYYAELGFIDRRYETNWTSMFRRIAEVAKNQVKNTGAEMDNLAQAFVTTAQSSLGEAFFDIFTGNFEEARNAAKKFFSDLLREIMNFLAREAVLKMISMFVSKWGGGVTTAASSSTSSGFIAGSISGHRAGGGMVWSRGVYELAEEGPEAVVPTRSGGKIPVQLTGGGASAPIDLHQTIVITPEMFAAMRTTPEEVITIVNSDYARNGQTRRTMRVRR
jgi:hypothetical protein